MDSAIVEVRLFTLVVWLNAEWPIALAVEGAPAYNGVVGIQTGGIAMNRRTLWGAASAATALSVGVGLSSTTAAAAVIVEPGTAQRSLPHAPPDSSLPATAVPRPPALGRRHPAQHDAAPAPAPAEGSSARAVKVSVDPVDACVSCTAASAGPADSRAESSAIRVLGDTIVGGGSAGTAHDQGQLVALPDNPLLSLVIASWSTGAETSGGSSAASSRSALVDLAVGRRGQQRGSGGLSAANPRSALTGEGSEQTGSAVGMTVLDAESDAGDDGLGSRRHSTSDALAVRVGDETLAVLHTGASSDGDGDGYLCDVPGVGRVGSAGPVGVGPYLEVGESTVAGPLQSAASLLPATGGEAVPAAAVSGPGLLVVPSTGLRLGGGAFVLVVAGAMTTLASMVRRRGARPRASSAVS
jgi:hypothetical protein